MKMRILGVVLSSVLLSGCLTDSRNGQYRPFDMVRYDTEEIFQTRSGTGVLRKKRPSGNWELRFGDKKGIELPDVANLRIVNAYNLDNIETVILVYSSRTCPYEYVAINYNHSAKDFQGWEMSGCQNPIGFTYDTRNRSIIGIEQDSSDPQQWEMDANGQLFGPVRQSAMHAEYERQQQLNQAEKEQARERTQRKRGKVASPQPTLTPPRNEQPSLREVAPQPPPARARIAKVKANAPPHKVSSPHDDRPAMKIILDD